MNTSYTGRTLTSVLAVVLVIAGLGACAPQQTASFEDDAEPATTRSPAPRAAEAIRVTVPQGTKVFVTLSTAIGSETSRVGDALSATTLAPVVIGDRVAIPAGSTVSGSVTYVDAGRKGLDISEKGGSVVLSFTRVTRPDGSKIPIFASISSIAPSKGKTGGIIGGSAAGGALLGKILGGSDKDAAVGAVVGGGIGTAIVAGTKGKHLNIPAGTELTMILDESVTIAAGA